MQEFFAHLGRAGEGNDAHARIVQHRADDLAGGARGNDVDDASRHAGFLQDRHQSEHGERRIGRGLEHDRAAGGERRPDLACRHRGREIPRRHQHRDAGRLMVHQHARPRRKCDRILPDVAHRFLGEPAEELRGVSDFAAQIRQRLAVLDGDELGQPLGVARSARTTCAGSRHARAVSCRPNRERRRWRRRARLWRPRPWRWRPRRLCSRWRDRSHRSGRRRRIFATCRRSTDRSERWREDCRTWHTFFLGFARNCCTTISSQVFYARKSNDKCKLSGSSKQVVKITF